MNQAAHLPSQKTQQSKPAKAKTTLHVPTRTNDPDRTTAGILEMVTVEFGEKKLNGAHRRNSRCRINQKTHNLLPLRQQGGSVLCWRRICWRMRPLSQACIWTIFRHGGIAFTANSPGLSAECQIPSHFFQQVDFVAGQGINLISLPLHAG
jgi:hypothetical protein